MKSISYLIALMFAVVLTTSCNKKKDSNNQELTLEQKYPELANLTWVSTSDTELGLIDESIAPRINIKIVDNLISVTWSNYNPNLHTREATTVSYDRIYRYEEYEKNIGIIEFNNKNLISRFEFNYSRTGIQNGDFFILLRQPYSYKLLINR